jgi:hypothetical protein
MYWRALDCSMSCMCTAARSLELTPALMFCLCSVLVLRTGKVDVGIGRATCNSTQSLTVFDCAVLVNLTAQKKETLHTSLETVLGSVQWSIVLEVSA